MLVHLMLAHRSLKLFSLLKFLFLFVVQFGWPFFLLLVFQSTSLFFYITNLLFVPYSVFLFLLFFSSDWNFLIFSFCWSSYCVYPFLSRVWWAVLWRLLWTFYWINCLFPFCLVLFLMFCVILLFGTYSSVSSLCLTLCFCVLGSSSTTPGSERVAFT